MPESKSYRTWRARLDGPSLSKSLVNTWCSTVAPKAIGFDRGRRSALTQAEAESLVSILESMGGIGIEQAHAEQGMEWLRRAPRKLREQFPTEYVEACQRGDVRYVFKGAHLRDPLSNWPQFTPAYRAAYLIGSDGRTGLLTYSYVGWRSGQAEVDVWDVREGAPIR